MPKKENNNAGACPGGYANNTRARRHLSFGLCFSEATSCKNLHTVVYKVCCSLRSAVRSVEDMMKRSFSEFRTQRELGAKDLPGVMKKCVGALNNLKDTVSLGSSKWCTIVVMVCPLPSRHAVPHWVYTIAARVDLRLCFKICVCEAGFDLIDIT